MASVNFSPIAPAWCALKTSEANAPKQKNKEGAQCVESPIITIAVIGSGVDSKHPDLASHIVGGWNFVDINADITDHNGQGTAVAGVIVNSNKAKAPDAPKKTNEQTPIEGIKYKAGGDPAIFFDEDGKIKMVALPPKNLIEGIKHKAGAQNVVPEVLKADTRINGVIFKAGTVVSYNPDGRVKAGTLARDTYIQGKLHKAGTPVAFPEGQEVKASAPKANKTKEPDASIQ